MASPTERMGGLAKHVAPEWTPARERAVRSRLDRAIVRRKRRQVTTTAVSAALLILFGLVIWGHSVGPGRGPAAVATHTATALPLLHLEDGSTVTAASADARVEPVEVGPALASTRLTAGAARFSVTPNPKRVFRVLARDVSITVLGTIFTVSVEPADVRVRVERGRVRVAWPAGEHELGVGEELLVPSGSDVVSAPALAHAASPPAVAETPAEIPSSAPPEKAAESAASPPHHVAERPAAAPVSWRDLAVSGDYGSAYSAMANEGPSAVHDEPGDLLLAADVARLGGHPEKAVPLLGRVVERHADDSRAPLAAFTLGRTLLDQLGRPRDAAAAFATSRRLDPGGALSQDALAREVESWSRAGEATLARQRASEYVERYPKGRRRAAVRRLGGLDEASP